MAVALLCVLAALFWLTSARYPQHIMAAGFVFLALRLAWIAWIDLDIAGVVFGLIAIALIAWGSIMVASEHVLKNKADP